MRLENWPERLAAFIETRRATAFSWGGSDCCLFAADAVEAITGVDFAAPMRGRYASAFAARRIIDAAGGLEHLVPLVPVDVARAGRGDVVMVRTETGCALAVHLGRALVGQGHGGIEFLHVTTALKAWSAQA